MKDLDFKSAVETLQLLQTGDSPSQLRCRELAWAYRYLLDKK